MLHAVTSEDSVRNGGTRDPARHTADQMTYMALQLLVIVGAGVRLLYLDRQILRLDEGAGLIFSGCDAISGCLQAILDTRTSENFQFLYPLILQAWRLDLWPDSWLQRMFEPSFQLRATKRLSYFSISTYARR